METARPRFEIIAHRRDDDSYFYSDTDYSWFVRSLETGDELASFFGSDNAGRLGSSTNGVASVSIDDTEVVAIHHDGTVERVALPVRIEIIEGGAAIQLTYADGRSEKRPRRAVSYTMKFGGFVKLPLIDPTA